MLTKGTPYKVNLLGGLDNGGKSGIEDGHAHLVEKVGSQKEALNLQECRISQPAFTLQ